MTGLIIFFSCERSQLLVRSPGCEDDRYFRSAKPAAYDVPAHVRLPPHDWLRILDS